MSSLAMYMYTATPSVEPSTIPVALYGVSSIIFVIIICLLIIKVVVVVVGRCIGGQYFVLKYYPNLITFSFKKGKKGLIWREQ